MRYIYILLSFILIIIGVNACQEDERFKFSYNSSVTPNPPEFVKYKSLIGGARIFFNLPNEKDILSVDAEYTHDSGKISRFSASYFTDSLDVIGISDTLEHVIDLYAVNRAGNRSAPLPVTVKAFEPALQKVAKTVNVLAGFNSIIISWENELKHSVDIHVEMIFHKYGHQRNLTWIFSSQEAVVKEVFDGITIGENEKLTVDIRIGDTYGNISETISMGEIEVMSDEVLPKENWRIPNANDSIAGIPMCFGDAYECRTSNVIDDVISRGTILNTMHTGDRGRTGKNEDGNAPWNFLIDLGDYYELSRIVTNQRHDESAEPFDSNVRGNYYKSYNVNQYNMYFLDEKSGEWELISNHIIETPIGLSELEFAKMGASGDIALMYPEKPAFTQPTRWFRYEALTAFEGEPTCLSEITLYGRKAIKN